MKIINLPNGKGSFTTKNEVAGEFIESIVNGGEVTLSDLKDFDYETLEIIERFIGWNFVYEDKETGLLYLLKDVEMSWKMSGFDMTLDEFHEEFYNYVNTVYNIKQFIELRVKPRIKVLAEFEPSGITTSLMEMAVQQTKENYPYESEESIKKALEDAGVKVGVKLK